MTWRIERGDCIETMAAMPEASVDAIVTDPPYGLEFMGKGWDSFRVDDPGTSRHRGERAGDHGDLKAENSSNPAAGRVAYGGGKRPSTSRCTGCGRRDQFRKDHECSPGARWAQELIDPHAAPPTMLAFQNWTREWALQALRVLKPGGHLLAFAGTRTYHRMASGVEDAGFEVRDCIAWMYGSGFPKSLDVSKAIDNAAGAKRQVVGIDRRYNEPSGIVAAGRDEREPVDREITAPATPEAKRWDGWGTALKPAFEPVVVARKPLAGTVAQSVLDHGTGALNVDGCRIGDELITAHGGGLNGEGRTYGNGAGIPALEAGANPHRGRWPANVVMDPEVGAMLDGQTGELHSQDPTTRAHGGKAKFNSEGWRTERGPEGWYGDTGGASRFFATFDHQEEPCPCRLAPVSTAATCSCPQSASDGSAPSGAATSPSREARPSSAASAATTTTTASESGQPPASATTPNPSNSSPAMPPDARIPTDSPASAVDPNRPTAITRTTDDPPTSAGYVDGATPPSTSPNSAAGAPASLPIERGAERFRYCAKASTAERSAGLESLPARFSPTMGDGIGAREHDPDDAAAYRANVHPTVKPIDLMRWLVRLVTPPGGAVLDPFTGSGTTGCAAVLEGFHFIGCEREDEYADIAEARIAWWAEQPADVDLIDVLRAAEQRRKVAETGQSSLLDLFDDATREAA